MAVARGKRGDEMGVIFVNVYKLPVIRRVSSAELVYSMVTVVKNTGLYT